MNDDWRWHSHEERIFFAGCYFVIVSGGAMVANVSGLYLSLIMMISGFGISMYAANMPAWRNRKDRLLREQAERTMKDVSQPRETSYR